MNFSRDEIVSIAMEILIKGIILLFFLYYSFLILKPFLVVLIWGVILAIAFYPTITYLDKKLPLNRSKIVMLVVSVLSALIILPTYIFSDSVIQSAQELSQQISQGALTIPEPTQKVKEWPVIGESVYALWSDASQNFAQTMQKYAPQIKAYTPKVINFFFSALGAIFGFIVALIIAAIFLVMSESSAKLVHKVAQRLIGNKADEWVQLASLTIQSVVKGVIGIALIQATLAFVGLLLIKVPFALLWAFVVLILAIVQLPPIIILGPIIAYVYSYASPTAATIFAIYAIAVGSSDTVLKPLLLGRGVDIPMIVILLGAIGGMIVSGILGLFIGSVILALTYKLFTLWLQSGELARDREL